MEKESPETQSVGPLRVTTAAAAVRAFCRETGWREDDDAPVPLSFPVVWMKCPEIGDKIRAAAEEIGLPVHEAQQFEYDRLLELDCAYDLILEMRREKTPPRLIATAEILALDGKLVGRVTSTLRLIDPVSIAAQS